MSAPNLEKYRKDSSYSAGDVTFLGTGSGVNSGSDFVYNSSSKQLVRINKSTGDYTTFKPGTPEYTQLVSTGGWGTTISRAQSRTDKESTKAKSFSGTAILNTKELDQKGTNKPRDSYPTSYYPSALATTRQDRLKFSMKTAGVRTLTEADVTTGRLSGFGARTGQSKIRGEVFLAIPNQINDSNSADWSSATMDPLQTTMASLAIKAMKGQGKTDLVEDFTSSAGKLAGDVVKNLKSFARLGANRDAMQVLLAQAATGSQGLLSRLSGVVANPNVELLFNGPSLRPFTFTFRMTPRDDVEAKNVKQIIRFFKEGMAVQTTDQDVFLKSPNVFDIQFQSGSDNQPHRSLPRIKTCALIGCDVDYTPDGSYMTLDDKGLGYPMTCYQMTLRFNEIEPIYARDYNGLDENDIGY